MARTRINSGPDPVDIIVGANVRKIRNLRGLSQTALAEALDMTFQQVQKYEKGTNRIASSNLVRIAQTLKVNLATLFEGATENLVDGDEFKGRELLALSTKAFQVGQLWDRCDATVQKATLALLRTVNSNDPDVDEATAVSSQRKFA